MRIVIQRVKKAEVRTGGELISSIGKGLLLLVGIDRGDTDKDMEYAAKKIAGLRIFNDDAGKMNLSLLETGGEILMVSQFTLSGSLRKGRRPSFDKAEEPEAAEPLISLLGDKLRGEGLRVKEGVFGAMMEVELTNDGPVTFLLEGKG